jgi:hypothetical protein
MTIHGFLSASVTKYRNGRAQTTVLADMVHNLLTTDGRDFYHAQCIIETAANTTKGANHIALTESTITPAAGDTTLAGEITTNGLGRSNPSTTITHTDNTNSSTVEHTFTAAGSFTDVKASALFNAATTGIMTHEANFGTGSGTLISGDTLKTTWTINIG